MDEADVKENRPVTPSTRKSRANEVVGSGSTWGAKEREKFRIETADAVDVNNFIEDKWFDFSTLGKSQRERTSTVYRLTSGMEFIRSDLVTLSKEDMLATELNPLYILSIWGSFRKYLREIYMPETTSSSDIRASLAREKKEKNKAEVVSRKEEGRDPNTTR
jgi:hypothetical protein